MATGFAAGPYTLSVVAETGDRFADFAPYVAAIDDEGSVVFSATLTEGGSGVFRSDGEHVTAVAEFGSPATRDVCSHPDADNAGSACFYAEDSAGKTALLSARDGEIVELTDAAGPLGPTMNAEGTIAFRAPLPAGGEGVFTIGAGVVTTVADTTGAFAAFHGLPVVDDRGRTVFRADDRDGYQGVYVHEGNRFEPAVQTGERFESLGLFPYTNDAGTIVCCGVMRQGSAGVFLVSASSTVELIGTDAGFESFRGALLSAAGNLVYYATPNRGELGIYTGPDVEGNCLLEVGGTLLDSTVAGFALNPVSINKTGQLAIRVAFESGRHVILRADPPGVG